eukprot:1173909-Pleurochrysis_carterae.AAC.2
MTLVHHAYATSRVKLCSHRACSSSVDIVAPFVDSRLPCVTTAGDAATAALFAGTTKTPTMSIGTTCPPGRDNVDLPLIAST